MSGERMFKGRKLVFAMVLGLLAVFTAHFPAAAGEPASATTAAGYAGTAQSGDRLVVSPSASRFPAGPIALGCSASWTAYDTSTRLTMQVTCTPSGTTFAWGWKADPEWTQVDSYDRGMKWTFSSGGGISGSTHTYNLGSGDTAHGSFKMPNNSRVHMGDFVTLTNLEFGQIYSLVSTDFTFGVNPCLGKPSSQCPQVVSR